MAQRRLRPSASTSSLPRTWPSSSTTDHTSTDARANPTLAQLVDLERLDLAQADEAAATPPSGQLRHASTPSPAPQTTSGRDLTPPRPQLRSVGSTPLPTQLPPSALLLPPHYGRPMRPSSPDTLATLLRPVLASLSRPASPANPPPLPDTSPPSLSTDASTSAIPLDRSASSLPAQFPPREPTDPAPTVESQGFVLYVGSLVAYVAYLVWAFLPEPWLEAIGIEWYPARDWALLVPSWIVMLVAFTYASYFCLNLFNTPPLSSPSLLDDPRAFVAPPARPPPPLDRSRRRAPTPLWAHGAALADDDDDAIPPLYDLPIEVVNRVLYGD
ncbi:hypothetical protein JCM3775_004529 [Rhodotorula graminis]